MQIYIDIRVTQIMTPQVNYLSSSLEIYEVTDLSATFFCHDTSLITGQRKRMFQSKFFSSKMICQLLPTITADETLNG